MDELVPLESRAQTTSIQRLNRSLWSDTSATNNGESAPTCPCEQSRPAASNCIFVHILQLCIQHLYMAVGIHKATL